MNAESRMDHPYGHLKEVEIVAPEQLDLVERDLERLSYFGARTLNWVLTPPERLCECINWPEQVRINFSPERYARIKDRLAAVERDFAAAEDAAAEGIVGADIWSAVLERTISRLRRLLEILGDPNLPENAHPHSEPGQNVR
jgi:hypothetical protein